MKHSRWEERMDRKTLTKADIVDHIYEQTDRNRAEIKNQVEILLETMKQAIKEDDALLVSGFGKFEAYQKKARKGRNPQTTQTITLPARKVIVFRLSRKFRADLNPQE
jgi:integration host factor subunit alpha